MKKIIFTAMILLILSCSENEEKGGCGCIESQERLIEVSVWTGGAWYDYEEWQESGNYNDIGGCFTIEETQYMTRQVSQRERWSVTCNN